MKTACRFMLVAVAVCALCGFYSMGCGGGDGDGDGDGGGDGGGGTDGGMVITSVKAVQPNGDELELDSPIISRYAKIKISYTGERDADPVVSKTALSVSATVEDADGVMLISFERPLADLAQHTVTVGDESFSFKVRAPGDINGDGLSDFVVGAPWYKCGSNVTGAVFVFFGKPDVLDINRNGYVIICGEEPTGAVALFGEALALADVNGDGYDDIIIGAPFGGGFLKGEVTVYFGGPIFDADGDGNVQHPHDASVRIIRTNGEANAYFGRALAAGDVDGDGFEDIVIGEYRAAGYDNNDKTNSQFSGAVHVLRGQNWAAGADPITFELKAGGPPAGMKTLYESGSSIELGADVVVADYNDDGVDDIVMGATYAGGPQGGLYFAHGGPAFFDDSLATPDGVEYGPNSAEGFGHSVEHLSGDSFCVGTAEGAFQYEGIGSTTPSLVTNYGATITFDGLYPVRCAYVPDKILLINGEMLIEPGKSPLGCPSCQWSDAGPAGDINGDGLGDMIFSSAGWKSGADIVGNVYIYLLGADGLMIDANMILGSPPDTRFGAAIAGKRIR